MTRVENVPELVFDCDLWKERLSSSVLCDLVSVLFTSETDTWEPGPLGS